jgi:hypothetical protein
MKTPFFMLTGFLIVTYIAMIPGMLNPARS